MSFADVKFQAGAVEMLRRAVARERLPHAMIFVGPRGVGKGLAARELAKLLFCESPRGKTPETREACGQCTHCVRVARGTHPDLHWFRKEPDRNDFRLLLVTRREESPEEVVLDSVSLTPMESPHTVTVLDDAEYLNREAANALLKCLEEPSPRAILILLCADPSQLPGTILSRCQWVPFRPLPEEFVATKLAEILKPSPRKGADRGAGSPGVRGRGPKDEPPPAVTADEAAFVCRFAGGSIEQAAHLAGSGLWDLKRALVEQLPRLDEALAFEMSGLINKWAAVRAKADRVTSESREETALRRTAFRTALAAMATALRDALLLRTGAAQDVPLINRDQRAAVDALATWPEDTLVRGVGLLASAQSQIARYVHIDLATENALVQMSRLAGVQAVG